jgi:2-keto-4-pentenoate hydratase/2-oxohepta-3-ene-1,7-dioic acid hydratase in catechol pathway
MRYCRFQTKDGPQYGELERQNSRDVITRLLTPPPEDRSCTLSSEKFNSIAVEDVKLLAPVLPSKIICVGRNYRDHARELGNEIPSEILIFMKPPSAVIGPGASISIPSISQRVDFEGELGIVIGKQ